MSTDKSDPKEKYWIFNDLGLTGTYSYADYKKWSFQQERGVVQWQVIYTHFQ